jgi:ureidoacrylate peracid hydrolase
MADDNQSVLSKHVDPGSTALMVIDVQNDFCAKGGYFDQTGADLSLVEPAIERLTGFIEAARASGVRIIFVRSQYDPVYLSETQNARRRRAGWEIPLCQAGTWGFQFYRVAPLPHEAIITKHRYDAFHATDLDLILRSNGVRNLILTGVATNVCVETTLRAAFVRDFEVVLGEDCCAARTQRAHDGTLEGVRTHFGLVAKAQDIELAWARGSAQHRATGVG